MAGRQRHRKKKRKKGNRERSAPAAPELSLLVERPDYNGRVGYIIVPQFPPGDPRQPLANVEGNPGVYQVTAILSVPGKNVFREEVSSKLSDGDSLVAVPGEVHQVEMRLNDSDRLIGSILFQKNASGRLATATMRVQANTLDEAESGAFDRISSALSYVSYANDVPVEVSGYVVAEESTGTTKVEFGMVGKVKPLSSFGDSGQLVSQEPYRRILAAYREGMNATNVFYQALSFAKVIEGCYAMRQQKNVDAQATGKTPFTPSLQMPTALADVPLGDEQLRELFKPHLGWKFTRVRDHFKTVVRNAVAHLDPSQDVLDNDRHDDLMECTRAIPILRYMARRLIDSEMTNP